MLQQDLEEAEKQVDIMTERIESNKSEMSRLQRSEASKADLHEQITQLRSELSGTSDLLADAKFEIKQLQTDSQVTPPTPHDTSIDARECCLVINGCLCCLVDACLCCLVTTGK